MREKKNILFKMTTPYERLATIINNSASKGQLVDVSKIKPDGTGIRSINPPTTDKSKKHGIQGLPIVSDNYASYLQATSILGTAGADYSQYSQQYAQQFGTQPAAPKNSLKAPSVAFPQSMAPFAQSMAPFAQPMIPLQSNVAPVVQSTAAPIVPFVTPQTKLVNLINTARAEGKVLDVSELKPDGTGTRKIPIPKTSKGTKRWAGDLPVVSNNYQSYLQAMTILGQQYVPLAQEYLNTYGSAKNVRTPSSASSVKSPTRFGPIMDAFPQSTTGTLQQPPLIRIPTAASGVNSSLVLPRPASPPRQTQFPLNNFPSQIPRPASPQRQTQFPLNNFPMQLPRPASPSRQTQFPLNNLPSQIPRPVSPSRASQFPLNLPQVPSSPSYLSQVARPVSPPRLSGSGSQLPASPRLSGSGSQLPASPRLSGSGSQLPASPQLSRSVSPQLSRPASPSAQLSGLSSLSLQSQRPASPLRAAGSSSPLLQNRSQQDLLSANFNNAVASSNANRWTRDQWVDWSQNPANTQSWQYAQANNLPGASVVSQFLSPTLM